jgi:DNA polymerase elongation subunit (family B)
MITAVSHENIFTNQSILPTEHRPYFIIKDRGDEVPLLDGVTDISDIFEMESYVNWDKKLKCRRIYLTHPSVTPKVSTEYFKLGYECYEFSVPYLHRILADLAANGKWPLDTHGEWVDLRCMIYDIENPRGDGLIQCLGIGLFTMQIKTTVDLKNEKFELDLRMPEVLEVTQLLCDTRNDEYEKILLPFMHYLQNTDLVIGHNILEYDNVEVAEKFKQYQMFNSYLRTYSYTHKGFFRGKTVEKMVTFYPISFDTLLVARFLWKDESDVGYGLKNLAIKYKIAREGRVYERHFGGFGNWDNTNPLCLQYNRDDLYDTFGVFKLQAKAILVNMLISGESFEDVVSGSNGRMADQMSLIRSYNEEINAPMINPLKASKGLYSHLKGELKSKKEIFEFFRNHTKCTPECLGTEDNNDINEDTEPTFSESDWKIQENILRTVKYGEEMPDWVEYYPFLCGDFKYGGKKYIGYVSTGGKTVYPTEPMLPVHDVWKGDVAAQYPSILEAKNITANTVKLSRKGEPVDGWCWFRAINHKEILNLFEWRPATEFAFSDGEGYFIGYQARAKVGYITRALRGIITAVGKYKKMKGWEDAYQKALKPMRNAMTHGVLLSLDSTCQQFNLAGCAIPTLGQEITTHLNKYIEANGWKVLETDTDGTEFRRIVEKAGDFDRLVKDVEAYWLKRIGHPILFDREHSAHKLFIAHKNYITIKDDGSVKLTGNTLHSVDKPKIYERCIERVIKEIIPNVNTTDEMIAQVLQRTAPIINEEFKNITDDDLMIIGKVAPSESYKNEVNATRTIALEKLLETKITFPTKMEFIVCVERLPETTGNKSETDPICYMYPRHLIDDLGKTRDYPWYKDMVFSNIDTIFKLDKVSTRTPIKSIFTFDPSIDEKNITIPKSMRIDSFESNEDVKKDDDRTNVKKQTSLF